MFSVESFNKRLHIIIIMAVKDPIPRELFDILACPLCKTDLKYNKTKKKLICSECKTKYPIKGRIPILLPPKQK